MFSRLLSFSLEVLQVGFHQVQRDLLSELFWPIASDFFFFFKNKQHTKKQSNTQNKARNWNVEAAASSKIDPLNPQESPEFSESLWLWKCCFQLSYKYQDCVLQQTGSLPRTPEALRCLLFPFLLLETCWCPLQTHGLSYSSAPTPGTHQWHPQHWASLIYVLAWDCQPSRTEYSSLKFRHWVLAWVPQWLSLSDSPVTRLRVPRQQGQSEKAGSYYLNAQILLGPLNVLDLGSFGDSPVWLKFWFL